MTVSSAYRKAGLLLLACSLISPPIEAQVSLPDLTIDAATRERVIDESLKELVRSYVFPDVAVQMERAIRERQQQGEYDLITSGRKLAEALTAHLRQISLDEHLTIEFNATPLPPMAPPPPKEAARQREQERAFLAKTNFGFEKIDFVAANTGYLDLRAFFDPDLMGDTAVAAINFLANADAIVIDLRSNRGGSPNGVAFLASFLFSQPVRLNDLYDRRTDESRQFWTLPFVPGKRLACKDVYLLTSARTFSAAEDFAYALKALRRVTIVGETTRGGAHTMTSHRIHDHFYISVPWGRSFNSLTHTNWERVGVSPDVQVPADRALSTALLLSVEKRLAVATDASHIQRLTNELKRLKQGLAQKQQ